MKNCMHCKHAKWDRTALGRLHPSGGGVCLYPYKVPALPASMYWIGSEPTPSGRAINRNEELASHCVYFAREDGR